VSESAESDFEQTGACDRRLKQAATALVHPFRHGGFSIGGFADRYPG
jgi:hypothetical protein